MSKGGKGTIIRSINRLDSEPEPVERVGAGIEESESASKPPTGAVAAESGLVPSVRRRRIYIKERLPAVLAEMKSLSDEKKEFAARRHETQPEERRQVNRRLNFLVERLAVLRKERAALIEESRRYSQLAEEVAEE